jgi:hypothetical protein
VISDDTSRTQADLTIEVYTTPARTFVSATPPQAPDDEPTWSPMSATLIYGEYDAILVDTLATYRGMSETASAQRAVSAADSPLSSICSVSGSPPTTPTWAALRPPP